MTDLDFDEIDRAVTSAIGTTATATEEASSPELSSSVPVTNLTNHADNFHSNDNVSTPSDATPVSSSEPTSVSIPVSIAESSTISSKPAEVEVPDAPKVVPPALRRNTGRIMDVVHPSKSSSVSPFGVKEAPSSEWSPASPDTKVGSSDNQETDQSEPINTPFLPDAKEKVEKRPLGAFSDTATDAVAPELPDSDSPLELGSTDQPIGQDTPLPAELHSELLDIEANSITPETPPPAGTSPEVSSAILDTVAVPNVQPSIVQQYQEKPSSDTAQSGAIFDTETYHKPVTQPAKKRRPLVVVLWVVGLVVIGVVAGVAIYQFVLPHL